MIFQVKLYFLHLLIFKDLSRILIFVSFGYSGLELYYSFISFERKIFINIYYAFKDMTVKMVYKEINTGLQERVFNKTFIHNQHKV